jgi:TRAP-type C4-dicarboxylate transport system substrate-binding protein
MSLVSRRSFILSAGAGIVAPAARAQQLKSNRLRVADTQSYDFPTVQALLFIDRHLRTHTETGLSLQVFAGAQLGDEGEILEQTRAGAIDMARINLASLADRVPICGVLCLPELIASDEHLDAVLASPIAEEISAALKDIGLVLLSFYPSGARSIYNRMRRIQHQSDLQGMTIRVQSCSVMKRILRALGAQPIELSFNQLLPALQAGLVDGAENNWPSYVTTDQYLAAPYLTLTEHARPPEVLVMSEYRWSNMLPSERDALRFAAVASQHFMRGRWREWTDLSQQLARQGRVEVVERNGFEGLRRILQLMRDEWLTEFGLGASAEQIARLAPAP